MTVPRTQAAWDKAREASKKKALKVVEANAKKANDDKIKALGGTPAKAEKVEETTK